MTQIFKRQIMVVSVNQLRGRQCLENVLDVHGVGSDDITMSTRTKVDTDYARYRVSTLHSFSDELIGQRNINEIYIDTGVHDDEIPYLISYMKLLDNLSVWFVSPSSKKVVRIFKWTRRKRR